MRYILKLLKEHPRYYLDKFRYYPRNLVWELTLRCNMNCAHCGSEAGAARGQELNHEEALSLCRQLGELNCELLTLLGGEPFLREDWDDLALCLQEYDVKVNAISNGYLMDQNLVDRIKRARLTNVGISIDGIQETHEKIRRKPGSFQRAMNALSLLHQNGVSSGMVTTITKDNLSELDQLYQVAIEKQVEIWQLQIAVPRGNLCEHRDLIIQPEDLLLVEQFVLRVRRDQRTRVYIADNIGYFSQNEEIIRSTVYGSRQLPFWNGCFAGMQGLGIEANGDINGPLNQLS